MGSNLTILIISFSNELTMSINTIILGENIILYPLIN